MPTEDQELFDSLVSSPDFANMSDEDRDELYKMFGRKYVDPVKHASVLAGQDVLSKQKDPLPQRMTDLSVALGSGASGAMSGFRAGRLPGAAIGGLVGAALGVAGNRAIPKAIEKASFGKIEAAEPEGASWSNILSVNPFGKGALVNAALRAGEAGASALLDNKTKEYEIGNNPKLAKSPVNTSTNPLKAAALAAGASGVLGGGATLAGSQHARRLAKEQEIQQALKSAPGTEFNPAGVAAEMAATRNYIPKGEGQSVGPKVQPYGSETNLPGAGKDMVGGVGKPKMPVFPDAQNVDIQPVSKQVGQVQEFDIGRNKIAELAKRTGLDIKALTKPEWDELKELAKTKPDVLYEAALDPIFKAKTKTALPQAAEELKSNLEGLTKFFPSGKASIKKGVGKAFASRLVEESGDGKFANPESLIFRMEQIGEPLFNEMFGSPKAFSSIKKLAEVAKSQKSGTGMDSARGAANNFVAFTKLGVLLKVAKSVMGPDVVSLGKDKDKLVYLPWDKIIEKFATPKTVNLLTPGNQRFTRRAIDFESDEASESGAPIVPR